MQTQVRKGWLVKISALSFFVRYDLRFESCLTREETLLGKGCGDDWGCKISHSYHKNDSSSDWYAPVNNESNFVSRCSPLLRLPPLLPLSSNLRCGWGFLASKASPDHSGKRVKYCAAVEAKQSSGRFSSWLAEETLLPDVKRCL